MPPPPPQPPPRAPYALDPLSFRFPAVATFAGQAPLGGAREVALAAYLTARLAHDTLPEREVGEEARNQRANAAKRWISALTLPLAVRAPFAQLIAASAGAPSDAATALRRVIAVTAQYLDAGASFELERLADLLEPHVGG